MHASPRAQAIGVIADAARVGARDAPLEVLMRASLVALVAATLVASVGAAVATSPKPGWPTAYAVSVDPRVRVFSPDGQLVLVGRGVTVEVWDSLRWRRLHVLDGRDGVFSPDGRRIVTFGLGPADPRIWDAKTGTKPPRPPRSHRRCEPGGTERLDDHGRVQPRRTAPAHGRLGRDRASLGRCERAQPARLARPSRRGRDGRLQPGREPDRDRRLGRRDRASLGRT